MNLDINVYIHDKRASAGLDEIRDLFNKLMEPFMTTQAEQVAILNQVLEQQKKTLGEITDLQTVVTTLQDRIAELESAVPADASQELIDAVAAVKATAQLVDDAIPDNAQPTEPDVTPTADTSTPS